jgi:flagellar biosynthesis/type III secretory pathway chaperone
MKIEIQAIQDHYDTQHGLFQELLECVALEKDSLVELNVESLWNLMEKKQALLRSIETSGNELKAMTRSTPPHDMPVEDRKKVLEKDREIKLLKEEIRTRVRENMDFIQDSLNFF